MADFTQRYSGYSNAALLEILDSPEDYQPQAVQAAQEILDARQLREEDIKAARAERQATPNKMEPASPFEIKTGNTVAAILSAVDPVQSGRSTADRIINAVSIVFGVVFLYQVYRTFDLMVFLFSEIGSRWDISMLFYFLEIFIIPTSVFLFFRRRKPGWMLLTIYLTYSAVTSVLSFLQGFGTQSSHFSVLDDPSDASAPILASTFFVAVLLAASRADVREIYGVNKRYMVKTMVPTAMLAVFIMGWLLS